MRGHTTHDEAFWYIGHFLVLLLRRLEARMWLMCLSGTSRTAEWVALTLARIVILMFVLPPDTKCYKGLEPFATAPRLPLLITGRCL
jgi:hypothetical protein